MKHFIKKNLAEIGVILVAVLIFLTNYRSGTYLSGWDNLQTELYPWLAVKRAFFSVWQEYQSFGLVSGMAHASDLVRAIFLWLVSFFVPQNLIRYFFHTLMLALGGIGAYKLMKFSLSEAKNKLTYFAGAVFYLLNLGTIQIFTVPFESFSTFFGFLPWEILIFMKIISSRPQQQSSKKINYLLFFIINLLATPQAYVQTIFVIYLLLLLMAVINGLIVERSVRIIKNSVVALIFIVIINSFWLLPQLYFLKTAGNVVQEAKTNQLATNDTFYQNKEKGTLSNFIKMEGFYFDLFDSNNRQLFFAWKNHFSNPLITLIPYLFTAIIILGMFRKNKYHGFFLLSYALSALFLLNNTFPVNLINDFIRQNPTINQIFRSPFTKIIIPYSLTASYFFASGLINILMFLHKRFKITTKTLIGIMIFIIFSVFLYSSPVFIGYFFSPAMKIKIPTDYLQLMDYLKTDDKNKRIALLPDNTFWGWFRHTWGYDGSGFLWYGIEQPIVSRTFDVWSDKSEGYFWEMKNASEAENMAMFDKILDKYGLDYILLDNSMLPVSSSIKSLQYDRLESLLKKSRKTQLIKQWGNVALYSISHLTPSNNFFKIAYELPNIGPAVKLTNNDVIYQENTDYQTDYSSSFDQYYPFLDLTTQTIITDKKWQISENENQLIISANIDTGYGNYRLVYPQFSQQYFLNMNNDVLQYTIPVDITTNSNKMSVSIPKTPLAKITLSDSAVTNCGEFNGQIDKTQNEDGLIVSSYNNAIACFGYSMDYLEQRYGYLVRIDTKNIKGRNLFFYILDETKKQSYLETRLDKDIEYFILSPKYQYGRGYYFAFQNNSYKNFPSVNKLTNLSVYLLPEDEIRKIKLVKNGIRSNDLTSNETLPVYNVQKNNYWLYNVNFVPTRLQKNVTLIINQAYHQGWKAFQITSCNTKHVTCNILNTFQTYFPFLFRTELKKHDLVNNWANAWKISQELVENGQKLVKNGQTGQNQFKIVIIFWPQYLEFIGFFFLIVCFGCILFYSNDRKSDYTQKRP